MARKSVLVSDLSGKEIPEVEQAEVVINTGGYRYSLDLLRSEVENLLAVARKGKRRGRKPKP